MLPTSRNLLTRPRVSSETTDSFFLWPLLNTNTHVCDFEIPLKGLATQTNKLLPFYICWFCWYAILDWSSLSLDWSNQSAYNSFVFIPSLSVFVLGFNVDHSKLIRLSFFHGLSWFANIKNSKPNKKNLDMTLHWWL